MVKYLRGDVGIGTLIVFIAMVLVAAIAATVLLNVSGMLQQRASSTGKQTTQQVSSNIMVLSVVGQRNSGTGTIDQLFISVKAAAGASRLDLKNMLVVVNNGSAEIKLTANNSTSANSATNTYGFIERVDPNDLFNLSSNSLVIDPSSLIDLNVSIANAKLYPRKTLTINLMPEVGTPLTIEITAPPTFDTDTVSLYP
ncbi:MAG: archaellin/type IV pilin N-terminal domain-containing protein [Candidatus Anstonellales archaeon]